jgi:hypothetical protein
MRKFNKAMAIKVLLISFIAWCIGTALFIFEVERIEYYTDYISKLLLLKSLQRTIFNLDELDVIELETTA